MSLSRRALLAAPALLSSVRAAQPQPAAPALSNISLTPESYCGWPTLARRANRELLVAYSGGRETHVCPFGRVELMRSTDDGTTWSWPEVLMDTVIDDRDAGLCITPSGSILVTTFTSLAYETTLQRAKDWPADRTTRWLAVQRRSTQAQRNALLGTWMLRSTDAGMTWSAPYRVPVNSPHGPVAVSGNRLIYPGKELWEPGQKARVAESTDDGQTWRVLDDIPLRPGDRYEDYHELHAVETTNHRLVVHIRNHSKTNGGETLQCESADGGKTWSEPHPIGVWGLPSHLLRLRDGRLLMSYGYRRAPYGNQARVSEDHGRSWSQPITISADGVRGDLGYPSTVELADGALLTVWYEQQESNPKAVLRQARWRL